MAVAGFGSGLLDVAPAAMIGDIIDRDGGTLVASYQMAGDVGSVVGPVAGGFLVDSASYGAAFGLAAAVLGGAAILGSAAPETRPGEPCQAAPASAGSPVDPDRPGSPGSLARGSLWLSGDVMGRSRYLVARVPARLHGCGEGGARDGRARPAPAAAAGGLAGLCRRARLLGPAARAGLRRRDPRLRHRRPLRDRSPARRPGRLRPPGRRGRPSWPAYRARRGVQPRRPLVPGVPGRTGRRPRRRPPPGGSGTTPRPASTPRSRAITASLPWITKSPRSSTMSPRS